MSGQHPAGDTSARPHAATAPARRAIRLIALVEAGKGVVVLLAASGLLALIHRDLHEVAARLVAHAHLNPAARYPRIFIDAASNLQQTRLAWLALGAFAYATIRLFEAYGLYFEKRWAEWLAAVSGGLYIPFEVAELVHRPSGLSVGALLVNAAIVAVMVRALAQRRRAGR